MRNGRRRGSRDGHHQDRQRRQYRTGHAESRLPARCADPAGLQGRFAPPGTQKPLEYGELLMFGDMAIYTTCKNNTFNGMPLPDIWLRHGDEAMERLTDFGYEDFKGRLGHRR